MEPFRLDVEAVRQARTRAAAMGDSVRADALAERAAAGAALDDEELVALLLSPWRSHSSLAAK